jgi:hypothetical protein
MSKRKEEVFAHIDGICSLAWHPSGKHILTCGAEGDVKQFNAENLKEVATSLTLPSSP